MFSQPCEPVQPLKFYIYQLQSFRACSFSEPGARELLLERIRTLSAEDRQRIAGGLFLEQHLSEHPWRTLDPEEADLFVVPSVLDLAAASLCTTQGVPSTGPPPARVKSRVPFSLSESLGPFMDELAASPYYQRSQGRDHLMVWLHYHVRNIFMPRKPGKPVPGLKSSDASRFRHLVRNFILGQKHARSTVVHSKTWDMRMPGTCVFTVPHLAPSALDRCQWEESHPQGKEQRPRLHCPPDPREGVPESSFEEYLKNRNHTLFFSGNVGRDQEPPLRRAAVKQLAAVHPPNILVAYEGRTKALQLPPCAVSADGTVVPAPCRAAGVAGAGLFRRQMTRSRFSLHIKGDDATSSRVFEAWGHRDAPDLPRGQVPCGRGRVSVQGPVGGGRQDHPGAGVCEGRRGERLEGRRGAVRGRGGSDAADVGAAEGGGPRRAVAPPWQPRGAQRRRRRREMPRKEKFNAGKPPAGMRRRRGQQPWSSVDASSPLEVLVSSTNVAVP